MEESTVIIIGGGPAGAACAWKLKQKGQEVLLLEKKPFPRQKICAGWITPGVLAAIDICPETYPFLMQRFHRIHFHMPGLTLPIRTRQYAIRRIEFDDWMRSRARVPVKIHSVKKIVQDKAGYIIDNRYRCQYLVGAGGTHCPVHRIFFKSLDQRQPGALIAAVEAEYQIRNPSDQCHLWFFDYQLPGYAWYVPKGNGWINIGIGGKVLKLKKQGKTILWHWQRFAQKLQEQGLIPQPPPDPKGHTYFLNQGRKCCRRDNAFIIGDAAGLSTLDMGEGIHGAIESGFSAAAAISENQAFNPCLSPRFSRFSLPGMILAPFLKTRRHSSA